MDRKIKRLYVILSAACVAGYVWIGSIYFSGTLHSEGGPEGCIIKNVLNIPCPSCGSTRAVFSILDGDFVGSLLLNPIGILLTILLLVTPLFLFYDSLFKKTTIASVYIRTESFLKRKYIAIPFLLLLVANWVWNIHKGL